MPLAQAGYDVTAVDIDRAMLDRLGARAGSVEQLAKTIRSRLPKSATMTMITDQSRFIKGSIKEAQDSAIQGGMWALLVIYVNYRCGSV